VTLTASAMAAKKAAGAALFAAALGIGFLALSLLPALPRSSAWKGYRVLLVDEAIPESEALAALKGAGFDNILSESTEPVTVSYWAEPETTSLAAARASLAPGDPRLDEYLRRLGLWFKARVGSVDYRAIYVGVDAFPFADAGFERKIDGALHGIKGRFVLADEANAAPERRDSAFPFFLALFGLLAAAAAGPLLGKTSPSIRGLLERKAGRVSLERISFRLVILLPWAALACGGGSAAALSTLWGISFAEIADSLDIPLEEFHRGGGLRAALEAFMRQGALSPALAATAFLALIVSPGSIGSVALACLGSIAALAGYGLSGSGPAGRKRFVPLPISRPPRRRGAFAAEKARGFLACACVALWGIASFFPAPSTRALVPTGLEFPAPAAVRGDSRPMPSEARARGPSETGSTLPGISSYLEHRAFQEALPYIPVGDIRDDPFAPASLPLPEGKAQVLSFGDDWARKVYASLPSPSVEAMLLAQGSATVGQVGVASSEALSSLGGRGRPLAPIGCLLYIFLLVPPTARLFRGIPLARGAPPGELRQEA
jgi:hypothetical protein